MGGAGKELDHRTTSDPAENGGWLHIRCTRPIRNGRDDWIRTSDPLTPRRKKGGNSGQRETATPAFPQDFINSGQHQKATSRYRLSAIC